jgi:acyl-coenzyme A synthetase/AMP-(fatty) acid ligase
MCLKLEIGARLTAADPTDLPRTATGKPQRFKLRELDS